VKAIAADSLLMKQQFLIVNRSRNTHRTHTALEGNTPSEITNETCIRRAARNQFL
jgi:hypothetical protein